MPQRYTQHDTALVDPTSGHLLFELADNPLVGRPSRGSPGSPTKIEFQFPPKITGDNRKANWTEQDLQGKEPVAVLGLTGPRELTMTWTYIIDSLREAGGAGGGLWTPERVASNIKRLRGYYSLLRRKDTRANLVVKFKIWQVGGSQPVSARIRSIDVKYGETLVGPPARAFYLRSDVTCDIRLWEQQGQVEKGENPVQKIPGLIPEIPPDWY